MPESAPRPQLAVGAVARLDGALLLIRRGTAPEIGRWSLPGGRVEFGEVMAEAVVREVREETGIDVFCGAVIDWVERMGDGYHYVIVDFEVMVDGDPTPTAGTDALEAAWVDLDEISELPLVDGLADFLVANQLVG